MHQPRPAKAVSKVQQTFERLLEQRVVVLDGAMGTSVHTYTLDVQRDWQGHENCTEILVETRPDIIRAIHESFLAVGCDAVETNTFGANRIVLGEFSLADRTFQLNRRAAQIAREACAAFSTPEHPRYVVGSIGPGTKLISLGQTSWEEMYESYLEQCRGLLAGEVDALLIETAQDLLQVKVAINAAEAAMAEANRRVPLMVQVSMDTRNRMLLGSDMGAVVAAIAPFESVRCLGLNCATGPAEMGEHVQYLSANWPRLISVQPNAGMPVMADGQTRFPLEPGEFAAAMLRFVREYGVNIVGGCCGTTPAHLRCLVEALRHSGHLPHDGRPAAPPARRDVSLRPQLSSLQSAVDIRQEASWLIIAERTNTNGSRQFRRLLQEENFDAIVSMARDEVRDGAQVLDLCVDFVGRDGVRDMREVASRLVRQLDVPLMFDSTDPAVMEAGLKLAGGRCVLNSMNLEEGEEKLARICALARKYGAAVVAGTIDEDRNSAMARTAARKLEIARRLHALAVGRYGLRDEDIFFDPLVLPISTGLEQDRRNALETIEGIRLISRELPRCHTLVGVSNVSFGLKPAARVVLNSVFLHECRQAGLTAAIVHVSRILPRNRIPDEQWNAALDLIYDRRREGFDPLTHFVAMFPEAAPADAGAAPAPREDMPIEQRLRRRIIDGEKRGLAEDLDLALQRWPALEIINNILLPAMKVVGELFGSGQMQLPFVLQSAEVMKAAVAHLQPHMERVQGASRGGLVLATVKGDVHDIGKNLVDIILSNNGYTVHNLGIKQPIGEILEAWRRTGAQAIGMSGLLVKSVAVMKENLEHMNALGITAPVLLGGAALTRDYAEQTLAELYNGPLFYCRDAFDGLRVMDMICSGRLEEAVRQQRARAEKRRRLREAAVKPSPGSARPEQVARDVPVPAPPFWGRRTATGVDPREIFPYLNQTALFVGQWGFRRKGLADSEYRKLLETEALPVLRELQDRAVRDGLIAPRVVWGYFPVQSDGDELIVYHEEDFAAPRETGGAIRPTGPVRQRLRFRFPRQEGRRGLCIADFFRPVESGEYDVLGVQLVTVGERPAIEAEKLRRADRYRDYLYLHGFAVETAEALAEYWHKRMRAELGIDAEDAASIADLLRQGYRGSRYSLGYPACPNLEDRALIMELLRPEDIGVTLSETFMLVPEQSTDAFIVHHPQAKYFDV